MWKLKKSVRIILSALFFLLSASPLFSLPDSGGAILTQNQIIQIQSELNVMKTEVSLLRKQSQNLKADSLMWQSRCTALEEKLMKASQMSESSGKSVVELQAQVQMLRTLLAELKKEFSELNKSYMRQKRKVVFWRTAAGILGTVTLTEGVIIWLQNK